ncbi:hypothetical protein FJW07_29920 [Mesorhizobium sp. B3-1-9]|uniref:hypothetical protein n=1 Tax=Mesorhizobium sp. B3-1-9 TaxID=2589892 RepID=UPI00112D06C0|nr:hypothetical protein [Mesorhizobium sp. B3-1-9]TPI30010.1 hypothetical protein FJW07_29920 [Mesorhizobium sp. B3-1-9]
MVKRLRVILIAGSAALLTAGTAEAAQPDLLVLPDRLNCLVANYEAYLQTSDDPIVIFLDACPRVVPTTEELLGSATNSVPSIKKKITGPASPDSIIALSKRELTCLVKYLGNGTIQPTTEKGAGGEALVRLPIPEC